MAAPKIKEPSISEAALAVAQSARRVRELTFQLHAELFGTEQEVIGHRDSAHGEAHSSPMPSREHSTQHGSR